MAGVPGGKESEALYERILAALRNSNYAGTALPLDKSLLPVASAAEQIAAVGCSLSALPDGLRNAGLEIADIVCETLREFGFAEVREPIDHTARPGVADERCGSWYSDVQDVDLYVGILLASSSGVTSEMYEISDHGGKVVLVTPGGIKVPCAHEIGRFAEAPRVEYGSLRDLPEQLTATVMAILTSPRSE